MLRRSLLVTQSLPASPSVAAAPAGSSAAAASSAGSLATATTSAGPPTDQLAQNATITAAVAGGLGVFLAAVVTAFFTVIYQSRRDHRERNDQLERQRQETFALACQLLGSNDISKRVAGVYMLRDLADQWDGRTQLCIDMLCSALRAPFRPSAESRELLSVIAAVLRSRFNLTAEPGWRAHRLTLTTPRSMASIFGAFPSLKMGG